MVKHIPLSDTKDSVELFLYDMAGKDVFEDIIDEHVRSLFISIIFMINQIRFFLILYKRHW